MKKEPPDLGPAGFARHSVDAQLRFLSPIVEEDSSRSVVAVRVERTEPGKKEIQKTAAGNPDRESSLLVAWTPGR
jgi:hypothetical protein